MSGLHGAVSLISHNPFPIDPKVTAITHNLPWFLREPAIALIGPKCYNTLVYDFNITDVDCLKYALSKGLGFGIVLGGSIVKIPQVTPLARPELTRQIMKIVRSHSARGLSLSAYVRSLLALWMLLKSKILETASYAISLAYASRSHFPFSTYGENFFITIQNIIITLMILFYTTPKGSSTYSGLGRSLSSAPSGTRRRVAIGAAIITVSCLFLWNSSLCSMSTRECAASYFSLTDPVAVLQACTIPLSLLSKAPQILENHTNRSTGNLSAFAVFSALLGCLARLFTTKQEVNDPLIFWGFAGSALLNGVLALQMVIYWRAAEEPLGTKHRLSRDGGVDAGMGINERKLD